mmetsp:Transcript_1467/g.3545  ORF Transcript_1467/g.3545 Transcript_1467/m.3545 type:complete len:231 (+) Transcript_1467:730-1422(+)
MADRSLRLVGEERVEERARRLHVVAIALRHALDLVLPAVVEHVHAIVRDGVAVGRAVLHVDVQEHEEEAVRLLEQVQLGPSLLAVGEALGTGRQGAVVRAGEGLGELDGRVALRLHARSHRADADARVESFHEEVVQRVNQARVLVASDEGVGAMHVAVRVAVLVDEASARVLLLLHLAPLVPGAPPILRCRGRRSHDSKRCVRRTLTAAAVLACSSRLGNGKEHTSRSS